MIQKVGNNSMIFEKPPVILAASSVVGEKEGQGPLGQYFDHVEKDPKFGMETWEQAESTMQLMAAEKAIKKARVYPKNNWIFFLPEIYWGSLLPRHLD